MINEKSVVAHGATDRKGTQSIERVVALIRELTMCRTQSATSRELAERVGIDRSTAYRMLQCLVVEGMLSYDEDSRLYCFGRLAYEIGRVAIKRIDLADVCRPTLLKIAEITGDTVFLMERIGNDVVCVDRAIGSFPIKTIVVDVGTRRPLGIGGGSLAILSALPEDVAEQVLKANAKRYSDYPEMNFDRVREEQGAARKRGFVIADVVSVPGARTISFAIRDSRNQPIAAIAVAAITSRMIDSREQELVSLLRQKTGELAQLIEQKMDEL